jgi:hypothetical protein
VRRENFYRFCSKRDGDEWKTANLDRMKKAIVCLCLFLSLGSFAQSKSGDTVPAELLTNDSTDWTISTISTINYVNTQPGAYYGTTTSGGGMLVKFKFLPGNRYHFQLYVQANSYGTRTETWTEVEGTVLFTKDEKGQNIFITKAEKGLYRIYNNGKSTQRAITAEELKGQHSSRYIWQKTMLKDDAQNIYLLMVDLKAHPDADVNHPQTIDPSWVSKFHIPVKG